MTSLFLRRKRQGENIVPATVVRQVFLGGTRDYMVEAKDGTQLRVLTAAGESIRARQRSLAALAARALPRAKRINNIAGRNDKAGYGG